MTAIRPAPAPELDNPFSLKLFYWTRRTLPQTQMTSLSDGRGILAPNELHRGLPPSRPLSLLIRWMKHQQVRRSSAAGRTWKVEILTHTLFFLFTTDWPHRPAPNIGYRGGPFLTSTPRYPNLEDLSNIQLVCTVSSLQLHVGELDCFTDFFSTNQGKTINKSNPKERSDDWERINRDMLLSTSKLEEQS